MKIWEPNPDYSLLATDGYVITGSTEEPNWAFYIRDEEGALFFWSLCDIDVLGSAKGLQCICSDMTGFTANNIIGGLKMFKRKCYSIGQLTSKLNLGEKEIRFNHKPAAHAVFCIEDDIDPGRLLKLVHLDTFPGYEGRGIVNYLFEAITTIWPHKIVAENLKITKGNVELIT